MGSVSHHEHWPELQAHRELLLLLVRIQLAPRLQGTFPLTDEMLVDRALQKAIHAQSDLASFSGWELFRWLTIQLARDVLESLGPSSNSHVISWANHMMDPPFEEPYYQLLQSIVLAWQNVPRTSQDALILHHWHHLSLAEIGTRLGLSRQEVAWHVLRAVRALRQVELEDYHES